MDAKRMNRVISLGELNDEEAAILTEMIIDEINKQFWRRANELPNNPRPQ